MFFLVLVSCIIQPVLADDVDMPATGDLWDNWNSSQDFYGQDKPVTDEDFDKAVEQVKDKQNRNWFGFKKRNKNIPKGEEFRQSNETEVINSHADKDSLPLTLPHGYPPASPSRRLHAQLFPHSWQGGGAAP